MIYFDNIIFSLQKVGGISSVWSELISNVLKKNDLDFKFVEYNRSENNLFRESLFIPSSKIIYRKSIFLFINRFLNCKIKEKKRFIFHSSDYRICPNKNAINIVTVHDFTYTYFFKGLKKYLHCFQQYRAIRKSDFIICVSESTKSDLLKILPEVDPSKITTIYNGVSEKYFTLKSNYLVNLPFDEFNYILYVGSRANYKNFELAVEVISKTNYDFIIVGPPLSSYEVNLLNSKIGVSKYVLYSNVNNEKLNLLYNRAFTFLYLSSYEGFGIPVIEAQKASCPVIAFNSSSLTEVIGDSTFLVNDLNVNSVLECLEKLKNAKFRKNIIEKGLIKSNKFSWNLMSEQILDLYNKALK